MINSNKKLIVQRALLSCFIIVVFVLTIFGMGFTVTYVYADTSNIETSDPLDDLNGAIIGGDKFSINNYPWNLNSQPQMIYFAEYGYSYYGDTEDYALYIYVYNPSDLDFDDSAYNKITIGFGSSNVTYNKYTLDLLTYSTAVGYEGLFYKFKVSLSDSQKSTALGLISSSARVYTVVSMELSVGGVITDYVVGYNTDTQQGSIYTYTGYALGYGHDSATDSTLVCTVEGFSRYLALDVEQTVYRPEGDYYQGEQSQLNSCWFTIPTEYIDEYGDLSKIKYEWYEYVTKPILVTENAYIYSNLYNLHGAKFSTLSDFYFLISAYSNTDSSFFGYSSKKHSYYNLDLDSEYSWWDGLTKCTSTFSGTKSSNFSAVFYTGGESYTDYIVSGQDILAQLLLNSQYLGDTSIVGKYASALFSSSVQTGRTRGYNLAESGDYLEIYWNSTSKSSLWQQIFGGYDVDTTYDFVDALYTVSSSDLIGTDAEIAANLYISESDVTALKSRYETAQVNGETLVLFRYGSTAYYARPIAQAYSYNSYDGLDETLVKSVHNQASDDDYSGYIAQQTVFLNFDIISLTFTDENLVSTEIPVVMSPQDVVSDVNPPLAEDYHSDGCGDWSTIIMVLALLVLLILVVIFWPIFSIIFKAIIWVICLPFKLIAVIFKSAAERRREKRRKRNEKRNE